MKVLLVLVLFFSCAISVAFAQRIDPKKIKKGDYIQVPEYKTKKFEGTWLYTNDTDTFKVVIYLKKKVYVDKIHIYIDYLQGKYLYKIKNNEITNSIKTNEDLISRGLVDRNNPEVVHAGFIDAGKKGKFVELTLQLINKDELRWRLKDTEKISINNELPNLGFSVPHDITLKRIE